MRNGLQTNLSTLVREIVIRDESRGLFLWPRFRTVPTRFSVVPGHVDSYTWLFSIGKEVAGAWTNSNPFHFASPNKNVVNQKGSISSIRIVSFGHRWAVAFESCGRFCFCITLELIQCQSPHLIHPLHILQTHSPHQISHRITFPFLCTTLVDIPISQPLPYCRAD